jgi:dual specificity protein kinase YAK1
VYLCDAYQRCNPGFGYTPTLNPRRQLTKPAVPTGNDGRDNENSDLIISVNDVLAADDGRSGQYEVRDVLGSGTFGQVVRCREKGTGKAAAVKVIKNHPAYFHQAHVEIGILHMLNTKAGRGAEPRRSVLTVDPRASPLLSRVHHFHLNLDRSQVYASGFRNNSLQTVINPKP